MKTVVNKQTKPYSQIKNSWITDTSISDAWYRLLCYIEMQSENWIFYKEEIKKRFWRWEDKYTGAMQSIKKAWYIDHYPVKNEKWSVTHRSIDLYDEPTMVWVSHTPGNPPYGNPPQYNNNNCNKNKYININLNELNFIDWYEQDKIEFIKYRNTLVKTKEWDICRWQKQNTFDLWLRFKTWIRKSWWKEQKQIVVLTDDELLFKDKSWLSDSDTKEIYKYCQENWKTSKIKVWEEYVWEEYWVPVYRPKYVLMPDIQFVKSRVQSIEKRAKDKWTTLNNLSSLFIKWQQ